MYKEEEKICIEKEFHCMGDHPFYGALQTALNQQDFSKGWTQLRQHMTDVGWIASSLNSQRL